MAEPMPASTERRAPRFEGDGRTLVQFFKDYKRLADAAKLTVHDAIVESVKYMAKDPRRLVEKLEEYRDVKAAATAKEWDEFVDRVKMDYSDADAPLEYTKADFDNFLQQNRDKAIRTVDDLVAFTRDYRCYASDPKKKGELSDAVLQRTYYNHLVLSLGAALTLELKVAYKDKRPYELSLTEIQKAAKSILREAESEGFRYGTDVKNNNLTAVSAPYAFAPVVKKEMTDSLYALISGLGEKIDGMGSRIVRLEGTQQQQLRQLETRAPPQAPVNVSAPGATIQTQGGPPVDQCYYCGQFGHRIPACPNAEEDKKRGLTKRLTSFPYKLVMPDGSPIRPPPGGWMKDGVKEWHQRNPQKSNATVASMLVEVGNGFFADDAAPEFDDRAAENAWYQVMAQTRSATRSSGNRPPDGQRNRNPFQRDAQRDEGRATPPHFDKATVDRLPPQPTQNVPAPAPARPANEPAPFRRFDQRTTVGNERDAPVIHEQPGTGAPALPRATVPGATVTQPLTHAPQFRVHAPIENEGLAKIINSRILESKIVLTVEEVLAISPSLRRYWKDQSSGKRVTIGYAGAGEQGGPLFDHDAGVYFYREMEKEEESRDLICAPPVLPLRYLDCRIAYGDRAFVVEGVLDNGSQMVLISKKFWEALGKPLDFDRRVSLEAANNTKNTSLGLCANINLNVAGLDFLVHAQVVEDAPFSLLLGRPFSALATMKEENEYDGSSVVTLTCLNTNRAVRIPTRARRESRKDANAPGF